jgi:DNA-directed RNA polymerase subunit E'/Rpb7
MSKIQNRKSIPNKNKPILDNSHIFMRSLLTQKIVLNFSEINNNIYNILETKIKNFNENKCIKEGFIKSNSVKLLTYSGGELFGNKVLFECVFECLITNPVESMLINCVAKSLTKVGVRAELVLEDGSSPYIIFIARDHHYNNEMFSQIKENDILQVRILGQRYELNDKFISVIAELVNINNYETVKNDLQSYEKQEVNEEVKQDAKQYTTQYDNKLKIKVPKSLAQNIKNYSS